MTNASNVGLSGHVHIVHKDRYGFLKTEDDGPNIVTLKGREQTVRGLTSLSAAAFKWVAIGSSTTAETTADTTLKAEIAASGGTRKLAPDIQITTVTSALDTAQFILTYTFTGTLSVAESGVFNAASAGDMLCRKTFTGIPIQDGDQLTITWKVTASSS